MKKKIVSIISIILVLQTYSLFCIAADTVTFKNIPRADVCFSPRGGCTNAIVKELNAARSEILVQAYSFTSVPIAKALLDAKKKGVNVQVILDKSQKTQRYSSGTFFKNQGIPILIDAKHTIAHNKIIIIDQQIVITGSFNFTKAAEEKNAENLLIVRSKDMAGIYTKNWLQHKEHSETYE